MPRARKPSHMRQNTETRDIGSVEAPQDEAIALLESTEVPKPPPGLLRAQRDSWDRYFRSAARQVAVLSLDLEMFERLWTLYDERARALREIRKARVVEGSQGQMRASPFYAVMNRLDAEIRQLEDRCGKHIRSRLNLGMVVGGDDHDRAGSDDDPERPERHDDVDDDGPIQDPRLYVLDRRAG